MIIVTPIFMGLLPTFWVTAFLNSISSLLELFVAAILGGILVGSSIGIALNHGCATGGTDIIALLIQKILKNTPLPRIIFALDGLIIIFSGFIKQNALVSVFSFCSLYIIMQTIQFLTKKSR